MFGSKKKKKNDLTTRVAIVPYVVQDPKKFFKKLFKCISLNSDEHSRVESLVLRNSRVKMWVTTKEFHILSARLQDTSADVVNDSFFDGGSNGETRGFG